MACHGARDGWDTDPALRAREPRAAARSPRHRQFALAFVGLVSPTNVVSPGLLVRFPDEWRLLINGGKAGGHSPVLSGIVLSVTNVL